jgi:hypothetical protein
LAALPSDLFRGRAHIPERYEDRIESIAVVMAGELDEELFQAPRAQGQAEMADGSRPLVHFRRAHLTFILHEFRAGHGSRARASVA